MVFIHALQSGWGFRNLTKVIFEHFQRTFPYWVRSVTNKPAYSRNRTRFPNLIFEKTCLGKYGSWSVTIATISVPSQKANLSVTVFLISYKSAEGFLNEEICSLLRKCTKNNILCCNWPAKGQGQGQKAGNLLKMSNFRTFLVYFSIIWCDLVCIFILLIGSFTAFWNEIILSSILLQGQGQGQWNFYIFGLKLEILTIFVNQFL